MDKIKIIYIEDANKFVLSDLEMLAPRHPESAIVKKIRASYSKLMESIGKLPQRVGIATFFWVWKNEFKRMIGGIDKPTTNYMPLDILRQCLELQKEDPENPIAREFSYRSLMALLSHAAIVLDNSLAYRREIIMGSVIPDIPKIRQALESLVKIYDSNPKLRQLTEETLRVLNEVSPDWQDLEKLYKEIEAKFKANQVSPSFPLIYLPPRIPISLFCVDLKEGVEIPEFVPEMMEYVKAGCIARGMREVPESITNYLNQFKTDRFGETKEVGGLDALLQELPEPKTIITDVYIVDRFPELSGRIETVEYRER